MGEINQGDLFYDHIPEADPNIKVGDWVIPQVSVPPFGVYAGKQMKIRSISTSPKSHFMYNVGGIWLARNEVEKV